MYQGVYEIARCAVEIRSFWPQVRKLCADYAVDAEPEWILETTRADLEPERGTENRIRQVSPGKMLPARTDCFRLQCNMDPEAARVSFGAIWGKKANVSDPEISV